MVKLRCPKCGKDSYTASPSAMSKCAYCENHFNKEDINKGTDKINET